MVFKAACFIFIFTIIAVAASSNDNLIAVVQVFRHGQRTPSFFYSTDPYSDPDTYWGGLGPGQLTNVGKLQVYELGKFSRKRYSDWLPTAYSNKDIYIQSTDVDRTHMSAQTFLHGLYTATGRQVWRKNVNWQPIPIHPSDPRTVYTSSYSCPTYTNLLDTIKSTEELVNLDRKYASLYEYISNNTNTVFTSFTDIKFISDSVNIEEEVGFTIPSWISAIYPEPLTTLTTKIFQMSTYNTQMKRLYTGVLLNTILEYFEGMIKDKTSSQKYQVYSCHDNNLNAILDSVGQTPTEPLAFASSLWFELRNIHFVNVVQLWMKSGDTLTQLSINGCALNCPLTEVKNLLSDILLDVDSYEAECNGPDK